jgi:hypothetical protein
MNKFTSTVILAAFTAVFSLGATAADNSEKKTTGNSKEEWKKEYKDTGTGNNTTREISANETPKDADADRKADYRDQEVMNKKPYKKDK